MRAVVAAAAGDSRDTRRAVGAGGAGGAGGGGGGDAGGGGRAVVPVVGGERRCVCRRPACAGTEALAIFISRILFNDATRILEGGVWHNNVPVGNQWETAPTAGT